MLEMKLLDLTFFIILISKVYDYEKIWVCVNKLNSFPFELSLKTLNQLRFTWDQIQWIWATSLNWLLAPPPCALKNSIYFLYTLIMVREVICSSLKHTIWPDCVHWFDIDSLELVSVLTLKSMRSRPLVWRW